MKPWEQYKAKPWETHKAENVEAEAVVDPMETLYNTAVSGTAGLGKAFAKTLYGGLDLAGVDTEGYGILDKRLREKALKTFTEEADKSVAGTIGELGGDIVKFALPGSGLAKALGVGAKAAAALDVGSAAALGGLKTPTERGETRLGNVGREAAFAAGGLGAGKVLEKAITGIKKMPGAVDYIRGGGYLTPGQAGESTLIRGLENIAEVTPLLAKGTKKMRDLADAGVSESMINQVARRFDETADLLPAGHKGMTELGEVVESGYDDAWDAIKVVGWKAKKKALAKSLKNEAKFWPQDEAATLNRLVRDLSRDKTSIKRLDKTFRDSISSADHDFRQILLGFKDDLRRTAGADATEKLAKMDASYGDYLTLKDAAASARGGAFDAPRLEKSARMVGGKTRAAEGRAPLQAEAENLARMMEKTGGQPLEWFRRMAGIVGPAPESLMRNMGNMVIGETGWQRGLEASMRDPAVRQWIRRAGAASGAAIGEQ